MSNGNRGAHNHFVFYKISQRLCSMGAFLPGGKSGVRILAGSCQDVGPANLKGERL